MSRSTPEPGRADEVVRRLRAAGCVFAEEEADLIRATATTADEVERMVSARVSGLPLEQVLGWASFHGQRIVVDPEVFVPRRRTEYLVDVALQLVRDGAVVVDLCCGTGALGVAVAAARPVKLYAADLEPAAVRNARRNVERVGGQVFEGDLFDALPSFLRGRIDILLANVPYVPSGEVRLLPPEARLYEPLVTLDGGPDGLEVFRRVVTEGAHWLAPGGHVLFETSKSQAPAAIAELGHSGLTSRACHDDEVGATVVVGSSTPSRQAPPSPPPSPAD